MEPYEVNRLVYSTSLSDDAAKKMNVEKRTLDEIFAGSDVVSLHTPDLPSTKGMITGRHLEMMKPGATFINTARGAVVNEKEMIEVLRKRTDLTAVLDVCDPEPPGLDSPLTQLPNVVLTPHIAGSAGPECQRLGYYMLQEFQRYLAGEPLKFQITKEAAARMA
jgi:phosphoglycerate dehydrogenase-like enzyme